MTNFSTPILFLVFNRPSNTKAVFEKIREIKPSKLYIAADGPRENKIGELELCGEVRAITNLIDWDCDLKTLFRDKNLGCKLAVSGGISWFFEHEEEGIIIEDDVLPLMSFFPYCEELLNKYRNDESVAVITGNNLITTKFQPEGSYFFSHYANIWGWATWKRVWEKYDRDLVHWEEWSRSDNFKKISDDTPFFEFYWKDQINAVQKGKTDTWDFQFFYSCWRMNGLCAVPKNNLTDNLGFDANATHTTGKMPDFVQASVVKELDFPLSHPKNIERNTKADKIINESVFKISLGTTLKWKLRRVPFIGIFLSKMRKVLNV